MREMDYERIHTEDGSLNSSVHSYQDMLFLTISNENFTLHCLRNRQSIPIVSEPVGAFCLGRQQERIFYKTADEALWSCAFDGSGKRRIIGGDGTRTGFFTANDDYIFFTALHKNGNATLFQMKQDLSEYHVLLKSENPLQYLSANQQYLYFCISPNPNAKTLVQYDIAAQKMTKLLVNLGISEMTLYQGKLVMQVFQNCISPSENREIVLIDPKTHKARKLTNARVSDINCYLDHAFYIEEQTRQIWAVPLAGGAPHLVWSKPSDCLNLMQGGMSFMDCTTRSEAFIDLAELEDDSEEMPKAAAELLEHHYILHGKPQEYWGRSLESIMTNEVAEYEFNREIFDYVVFLKHYYFNKKKENLSALLQIGNYRPRQGSGPILFVDGTLLASRKKGYIVATDGIYTPKGFFAYDYTFSCERERAQELEITTYQLVRYNQKKRSMALPCGMCRDGLDELADLIALIYVFSYGYFDHKSRAVLF